MNILILTVALMLYGSGQDAISQNQSRSNLNGSQTSEECPDDHPWTGPYENYNYHFSVMIPENLKGYWNGAACSKRFDGCTCMQDHGRIIPLSAEPYESERHIEIYAGYSNVDEDTRDKPIIQEVRERLEWIRRRASGNEIEIRKISRIRIAGLKGRRVVVRYFDKKLGYWQIEDFVEVLRGDVEYSLYLRTREERYKQDLSIYTTVLTSFTLSNPE